jgi:hypothetical protein
VFGHNKRHGRNPQEFWIVERAVATLRRHILQHPACASSSRDRIAATKRPTQDRISVCCGPGITTVGHFLSYRYSIHFGHALNRPP